MPDVLIDGVLYEKVWQRKDGVCFGWIDSFAELGHTPSLRKKKVQQIAIPDSGDSAAVAALQREVAALKAQLAAKTKPAPAGKVRKLSAAEVEELKKPDALPIIEEDEDGGAPEESAPIIPETASKAPAEPVLPIVSEDDTKRGRTATEAEWTEDALEEQSAKDLRATFQNRYGDKIPKEVTGKGEIIAYMLTRQTAAALG